MKKSINYLNKFTFFGIIFFLFQSLIAQNNLQQCYKSYEKNKMEKVYVHLNNVQYEANQTMFFSIYVTLANNEPTNLSDFVYVDILDGSNKKKATQTYLVDQGKASGSFKIPNESSGLYKIVAYTKYQKELNDSAFERSFFIQKVVSPRILMSLEFKKKSYGKGEIGEVDLELKNLDNNPIKNYDFKYDVFISGKKIDSLKGKTDEKGKSILKFKLPNDLKTNDGIVNVLIDYDDFQESITRSIPISLEFVDLQFLPESGNFTLNESCNLFFIAKNEFGKPLDISGEIIDENNIKITDFQSFYDGMGKFNFTPKSGKKYYAVLKSPFVKAEKIELPKAQESAFLLNLESVNSRKIKIFAPEESNAQIVIRNTNKVENHLTKFLRKGWNEVELNTKNVSMGIQKVSLLIADKIVAERLIFVNFQKKLSIEINTDKEEYLPRELVKTTIKTLDENNNPISTNFSVSVIDSKLLSYIDDKQHDMLSWLLLGFELKGQIHEPKFYFNEKQDFEKRKQAIDLLINTHGWRRYNQEAIFQEPITQISPELDKGIQGFVKDSKENGVSKEVFLFSDNEKVYKTKSDENGYFNFKKVAYKNYFYFMIDRNKKQEFKIINNIKDFDKFTAYKTILNETKIIEPFKTTTINLQKQTPNLDFKFLPGNDSLKEVSVDVGYQKVRKKDATGSVSIISASDFNRSSVENLLSGKISGVSVIQEENKKNNIRIRGGSSLNGSSNPLIVIDGFPVFNNELHSLNPNQIESFTILKDASTNAIYGSRAVNGAIIITTKNRNWRQKEGILLGKKKQYFLEYVNAATNRKYNIPDEFYAPKYESTLTDEKTDFRTCIYWNSIIQTDKNGNATFEFHNSDESTSFSILAEGISSTGKIGKNQKEFVVKDAIQTDVKIPIYLTQEDKFQLPLWIKNNSSKELNLTVKLMLSKELKSENDSLIINLKPNEVNTFYLPIQALSVGIKRTISIELSGENYQNTISKTIDIFAKGFPVEIDFSGSQTASSTFEITNALKNSIQSEFKVYYNPFSSVFSTLESMLREPSGCFEQVSSSNYPNIMALQLLKLKNDFKIKDKVLNFLNIGYQKLKNYESKDGGFEWYGANPGHEALTAYGLLQFHEMKEFIKIDDKLVNRSLDWLNSRKDNQGGFKLNNGRYGFSGLKYEVNNAYLVYVLSEIKAKGFENEYEKALNEALKSKDLYRVALLASSAHNLGKINQYNQLIEILRTESAKMELKNIKADQTIVRSYGSSMSVEIISLYTLALLKENKITSEVITLLNFIHLNKNSYGYGSTQATALALKTITQFILLSKPENTNEEILLTVNNQKVEAKKNTEGNVVSTLENLKNGTNQITVQRNETNKTPYNFHVKYQTYLPPNSNECKVELISKLSQNRIKISEITQAQIEIKNKTDEVIFNPIVRIGIPGGLTPEPWQLKELMEKEKVDYYEIFGSELVLYFRELTKNESKKITIDFKAIIAGNYKGIASSAYLYYANQFKNWNNGLEVEVVK